MARKQKENSKAGKKGKGSAGLNRKAGEDYLAKNRQKDSVFEAESGLQIEEIIAGDGPTPALQDEVTIHQRIKLIDGTVVRDTFQMTGPDTYKVSEGIEGLIEGLQTMKCGGRSVFTIPADLAWGKRGAGDKIGPYSVLIADVRLLEVHHL